MDHKKHQIKTIQDIIDCTNEGNLDNFLKDLKSLIQGAHLLNKVAEMTDSEHPKLDSEGFVWIDDGENKVDILLNGV